MSLARDIVDRIFFGDRDVHAIPVLDGAFSPNETLDRAHIVVDDLVAPDSIVFDEQGTLYLSCGPTITAHDGSDLASSRTVATLDHTVTALAWSRSTGLLAGLSGHGCVALDAQGKVTRQFDNVAGELLRCVTAISIFPNGNIVLTDGSRHNAPDEWKRDLLQKNKPSGRLVCCDADFRNQRIVADGLDWPAGVAVTQDGSAMLVTEAWGHRLSRFNPADGTRTVLVKNFAGYPSRISHTGGNSYLLAFFALRTQLMEFILREDDFRMRMLETVPPHLWAGPLLGGPIDYREAMQIGRIKKLGIQKPWAPPRSYGLVARIDEHGSVRESFHSRAGGEVHGVTAAIVRPDGRALVLSKGHGKLVELPAAQAGGMEVRA